MGNREQPFLQHRTVNQSAELDDVQSQPVCQRNEFHAHNECTFWNEFLSGISVAVSEKSSTGKTDEKNNDRTAVSQTPVSVHPEFLEMHKQANRLLSAIKSRLNEFDKLLAEAEHHWVYEDGLYRFYYQSYKLYDTLPDVTLKILDTLQSLLPGRKMNDWFTHIEGTTETSHASEGDLMRETRPIVEGVLTLTSCSG